jgi:ribosomal protein S18 acetylase RimI-like enzyme
MVRSSIVIKKLEEKDRDTAAEFVSRMMKWTVKTYSKRRYPKSALDHQILVATGTLDKSIEDPDHYCMLAIKDGETIGIALGQVLGGVGRIDWIAVAPEYQRQGIGRKLMKAVEGQMKGRGCHKMTLYVFDSQIPALGLYLNWGMIPEATLKEHHWGDDYVVMSKWLDMRRRVV